LDAALTAFDAALRLKPDYAPAHHNRGSVLEKQGRWKAALAAHEEALRLDPDLAETHLGRGAGCGGPAFRCLDRARPDNDGSMPAARRTRAQRPDWS
jgi:tetratricopeptide (TPR) repeat protein